MTCHSGHMLPRPAARHDDRYRARRRALAARYHPDHGGDTESFIAAMTDLDRRHSAGGADEQTPLIMRRPRAHRWLVVTLRTLSRRRTRYIEL